MVECSGLDDTWLREKGFDMHGWWRREEGKKGRREEGKKGRERWKAWKDMYCDEWLLDCWIVGC